MKGDKAFIFAHADLKNMFTFSTTFPCTVSCSFEIYQTILLMFLCDSGHDI